MPRERPLTIDEEQEVDALLATALELVPVPPEALAADELPPGALVAAVAAAVDAARAGEPFSGALGADDAAVALGVLWADELQRVTGWELLFATFDAEGPEPLEALCLARRDRAFAVLPVMLVAAALFDRHSENNLGLLFQLIVSGQLPPAEPGDWRVLG
jgi:hypothetical protein